MKNQLIRILKIGIPIILLFILVRIVYLNWQEVEPYLRNFQTIPLILSFVTFLFIYPESAFTWYVLLKKMGVKLSIKDAFYVWIISNTSRYIPGAIWQYLGRVELSQQRGVARKDGVISVMYEMLLIIVAGSLMSLFTLNYWPSIGIKYYMVLLGILAPIILLHPLVSNKVLQILAKLTKKEYIPLSRLKKSDYIFILPLFILNFLLNGLGLLFLTFAFTGFFQLDKVFLFSGIYALSWLVGYFAILSPGGIGVTEAILAVLLSLQMPLPLASTIAIVYRFLLVIAELAVFIITLRFKEDTERLKIE